MQTWDGAGGELAQVSLEFAEGHLDRVKVGSSTRGSKWLGRIERTDGDVISVWISERKLRSSSVGIHMWLFFQPADERARPGQSCVKVVDPEEQEEAVARLGVVGTCQRGMLVGTPLVKTEQDKTVPSESTICPK